MTRSARMVLVVLLAAAAAAPVAPAQAALAARPLQLVATASPGLLAWLWGHLALTWIKNGCQLDPDGRCLPQGSGLVQGENGCQVDPNGRCLGKPPVQPKNGCQLDPNGRCLP